MLTLNTRILKARKSPRQARAQETVDAILRAAAHILRKEGYAAATTNHIAEKAGVSIGSLYQYFPSKQAVMNALLEQHSKQINARLVEVIQTLTATNMRDTVRGFITAMMDAHAHDPDLHRVLSQNVHDLGGLARVHELMQPGTTMVHAYLTMRKNDFRAVDPQLATFVLVNAVESVAHAFFLHPPSQATTEKITNELCVLVERYLSV